MLKLQQIRKLKRNPKEIEEKIILALKYHEIEGDSADLEKIKKLFNQSKHPMQGIGAVLELPKFESREEMESFIGLLKDLWNNMPRQEFKGASLLEWQEKRMEGKGKNQIFLKSGKGSNARDEECKM